jgi:hypothetical protein
MADLQTQLTYARKQKAFAWAKYYETINQAHDFDHGHYETVRVIAEDAGVPEHIKVSMKEMATALKKKWECPVCLEFIPDGQVEITNCGHIYCKPCLKQWQVAEMRQGKAKWECGMCKRKHGFPTGTD